MNLWLDDARTPPTEEASGVIWEWVKTADEAIELLETGTVEFASLDHDLCFEHYLKFADPKHPLAIACTVGTGADVLAWMDKNNVWPEKGVRVHTQNDRTITKMLEKVNKVYGRTFQYQFKGGNADNGHKVPLA